jgi:hypothetical protein
VLPECETVRGMVQGRWKDHGTIRAMGDLGVSTEYYRSNIEKLHVYHKGMTITRV